MMAIKIEDVIIEHEGEVTTSDYDTLDSTLMNLEDSEEEFSIPYIDPEHLISEVQARRVLWDIDRPIRNSRDNIKRRLEAWKEVSAALFGGYEEFSATKKRMIERKVQKKWKSVKDAYIRAFKAETGKGENSASKRRCYIYHHHLSFLQPILENRLSMEYNLDEENDQEQEIESEENVPMIQKLNEEPQKDYLETQLIQILKDSKQNRNSPTSSATDREAADKMFLLSLLPKMKCLTPNAAIDFQIKVMQLLQTFTSDSKKQKK